MWTTISKVTIKSSIWGKYCGFGAMKQSFSNSVIPQWAWRGAEYAILSIFHQNPEWLQILKLNWAVETLPGHTLGYSWACQKDIYGEWSNQWANIPWSEHWGIVEEDQTL